MIKNKTKKPSLQIQGFKLGDKKAFFRVSQPFCLMVHKDMVYLTTFRIRVSSCTRISANLACLLNITLLKLFNQRSPHSFIVTTV